jgi:hypothetical protein
VKYHIIDRDPTYEHPSYIRQPTATPVISSNDEKYVKVQKLEDFKIRKNTLAFASMGHILNNTSHINKAFNYISLFPPPEMLLISKLGKSFLLSLDEFVSVDIIDNRDLDSRRNVFVNKESNKTEESVIVASINRFLGKSVFRFVFLFRYFE